MNSLGFILLSIALTACSKSTISPSVTQFSATNQVNSNFTYQLYSLNSQTQESAYIGTLQWGTVNGVQGVELPPNLQGYLSTMTSGVIPVQYFVKAYSLNGTPGTNGDLYFESPVVSSPMIFNGPSTALWYAIKNSAASQSTALNLSATGWQNLLFEMNVACPNCLLESGSTALQMIQSNATLQGTINLALQFLSNPNLQVSSFRNPGLGIAYSSPGLVQGALSLAGIQGQNVNFQLFYYDPMNLSQVVTPSSWELSTPAVSIANSTYPSQASWTFNLTYTGVETVTATQSVRGITTNSVYTYTIAYSPLAPILNIPSQQYQANHLKTLNISSYGSDPRGEPLVYTLVSGPVGMTLTGTVLSWNPTQEPTSQVGTNNVEIAVTDTDDAVAAQVVTLTVLTDHYPQFSSPPSTWSLSEGTTGTLSLSSVDTDDDPIEISCVSGCSGLVAGSPTGAGWPLNLTYPNGAIYTSGSGGAETILLSYMPSYLQEIGHNGTWPIVLSLNYPAADTQFRPVYTPNTLNLNLLIQNIADPPTWSVQPQTAPSPTPTENIGMSSMTGGDSLIPVINPPSDSLITYSISNLSGTPGTASNCNWISISPSGPVAPGTTPTISGTPGYTSSGICTFTVRATDSFGLYTDSSVISIPVVPVYQPVSASGTIPLQTATENIQFTLDVSGYFSDPDEAGGVDPMEAFTYVCLNCAALGIPTTGANSLSFPLGSSIFTWTPPYTVASYNSSKTYTGIEIQATDKAGYTATQTFNLQVNGAVASMNVAFANGTLDGTASGSDFTATINANSSGTLLVEVSNIVGNAPPYNYTVTASCAPTCSTGLVSMSGNSGTSPGSTNFTMTLSPDYADGDGGAYIPDATKLITVAVMDNSNTAIIGYGYLTLLIVPADRTLTDLGINGDTGTGTYNFTIDGSSYGSNTLNLNPQGPDASNDGFTYSFVGTGFGTFGSSTWVFNPVVAGCPPGSSSVVKNFGILATSSHGATISRNVSVTINNATAGAGGGCPY